MKHNFYLIFFLFFVSVISIDAQVPLNIDEQNTFKNKVISTANKTKSILSDFTQEKHLSIMENTLVSKGILTFQSPNLVKWEYTEPYQNIATFKADKLYVTNEGKRDTLNLSSNKLFKSLNRLIVNSIKGDMFDEKQFDIFYFKTNEKFLVKFIPKEKKLKRFIARFELTFSKTSAEVEQIKLVESNDDFTLITFQNKQLNVAIQKSNF